ncbi:MAG: cytochrome c biogenesis protein CcsA, partial [Deltaproteobacteria bacterium]|nr:cytochrome c biogenesis protein CcsA [Deltaproteobacteria bacterium]
FILQCISLILRTASLGQLPVINVTEALGFFVWSLVGVYLLLSVRFDIPALGAFVSPLAALTILLSLLIPVKPLVMAPVFQSIWLTVHLGTVFIGYGFFSLAFVAGVMIYRRFPSLNALDTLNYYSLTMGFPMITLGIIFGAVYAQLSLGKYWRWDPKEVWSLITWLIYAALLHQRLTVGWRGRRAALLSIAGFLVLCFTFLGVSFLLPSYHSFESLEQLQTK